MRVGFFTEVYRPIINGVVASVDGLAGGLRALGHDVYCFAPHIPGSDEGDGALRMPSLPLPISTPYRLTVPLVSRRNRRGIINHLDVLHAHSPFVTGWMSVRYARRLHVPLVYTYHTRLEEYVHYLPFDPKATRFAASTLTRSFANLADAVIVPTPAMRQRLAEIGVTAHIEVVPSGIDLEHFGSGKRRADLRQSLGARSGDRLLLFVGRLGREKNVEVLLDALTLTKTSARLVIAGDGPEREALETRANELNLGGRVRFLGEVGRDELPDLYASVDAFVFPSVTETQGLVLVEALAAGTAVIAADAPVVREVLGGAGRLVASSPEAFSEAIDALPDAQDDAQQARNRGAAARFGIDQQSRHVASLYEALRSREVQAATGAP
ncbi:MAG TPA: glycosyltransferase [Candidatus Rubrimentiphilum sp.]|nr:glycosyltransferase [Candidatus Rubrimentiphilum sp.]